MNVRQEPMSNATPGTVHFNRAHVVCRARTDERRPGVGCLGVKGSIRRVRCGLCQGDDHGGRVWVWGGGGEDPMGRETVQVRTAKEVSANWKGGPRQALRRNRSFLGLGERHAKRDAQLRRAESAPPRLRGPGRQRLWRSARGARRGAGCLLNGDPFGG